MTERPPRLARVTIDMPALAALTPLQEAERAQAVRDLQEDAWFRPLAPDGAAPSSAAIALRLSIAERRLLFEVTDAPDNAPLRTVGLALGPFQSIIKDYGLLVDSHLAALEAGREERLQAIDMGRRGLHNEGATLVRRRLAGKIEVDMETARRLFTLLCVMYRRDGA